MTKFIPTNRIRKLVLSHQDPDTGAGANLWLMLTGPNTKIYVSGLWLRFVPHFSRNEIKDDVFVQIPDQGMKLELSGAELRLLPAHFLHSPGNFQIYDPIARTLFSGDLGASFPPTNDGFVEVEDFSEHVRYMEGFHKRYMSSVRAARYWARMVRGLDLECIVPQHGNRYFRGKAMVNKFIDWIESTECGVDLLNQNTYVLPR
jgi:flavorubredoxin